MRAHLLQAGALAEAGDVAVCPRVAVPGVVGLRDPSDLFLAHFSFNILT